MGGLDISLIGEESLWILSRSHRGLWFLGMMKYTLKIKFKKSGVTFFFGLGKFGLMLIALEMELTFYKMFYEEDVWVIKIEKQYDSHLQTCIHST